MKLSRPIAKRRTIAAVVLTATGALGLSACGGQSASPSDAQTVVVTETATATPTPTPTPTESDEAGTADDSVGEAGGSAGGESFRMPNEVGKVLQAAQDDLQARSGNPFFYSDSVDATGADRFQALDSGWQVCSQNKAAGQRISVEDQSIVFKVVRVEESCP